MDTYADMLDLNTSSIQCFDHVSFPQNNDELLGRCQIKPMIKIDTRDQRVPRLAWHTVYRSGQTSGELLASFELFLIVSLSLKIFAFFSKKCFFFVDFFTRYIVRLYLFKRFDKRWNVIFFSRKKILIYHMPLQWEVTSILYPRGSDLCYRRQV